MTEPSQAAERTEWIGPRAAAAVLVALFVLMAVRAVATHRVFSCTIDEGRHVAAAVEVWDTGEFSIYPHSPPLPRYVNGLLPYLAGARMPEDQNGDEFRAFLEERHLDREHGVGHHVLESAGYWEVLSRARLGTLVFLAVLLWFVYRWSVDLFGRLAGLGAAALISASPTVLAHGSLATVDVAFAATFTAACYHLWRWFEAPSMRRWWGVIVSVTIAFLCKFPAPMFLAMIAVGFAVLGWSTVRRTLDETRGRWLRLALGGLLRFAVFTLVATWASYQFSFHPLIEVDRFEWMLPMVERRFGVGSAVHDFVTGFPVPMPEIVNGLYILYLEGVRSWDAFLLGKVSGNGFLAYFPVAFAVKSTPAILFGALGGSLLILFGRRRTWLRGGGYVLVAGGIFLGLLIAKRMNIGIRHALPFYATLAIAASALLAWRPMGERVVRPVMALAVLLVGAHGIESALAHPDYLAYFNFVARGSEQDYLRDSNLDWGQDLARLADHAEANGIDEMTLCVFGVPFATWPETIGLRGTSPVQPGERPSGWFAVSWNPLAGLGLDPSRYEHFAWLPAEPHARIGKSILLYRLP